MFAQGFLAQALAGAVASFGISPRKTFTTQPTLTVLDLVALLVGGQGWLRLSMRVLAKMEVEECVCVCV